MQNLHVLTNNNLGASFWEQRTGLRGAVELSPLKFDIFQNLIQSETEFILIDFYFSRIKMQDEIGMIKHFKRMAIQSENFVNLFILSPSFVSSPLEHSYSGNSEIVAHNFTEYFLRMLQSSGKKNQYIS